VNATQPLVIGVRNNGKDQRVVYRDKTIHRIVDNFAVRHL
jgi:hypothetical protein